MLIPEELVNTVTAAVLSAAAKESGLTHTELAASAGMSRITVQKLLSGRQSIKAHQFLALANVTDLTPAEIMDRIEAAVNRRLKRDQAGQDANVGRDEILERKRAKLQAMEPADRERLGRAALNDAEMDGERPPSAE